MKLKRKEKASEREDQSYREERMTWRVGPNKQSKEDPHYSYSQAAPHWPAALYTSYKVVLSFPCAGLIEESFMVGVEGCHERG